MAVGYVVSTYVGQCNFHAKMNSGRCELGLQPALGRPTSRWWSHVTYFFVNGFDDLLVSVEVALVQGVTVDKVK